jgi:Carboxypeptidase regulatory-like domain/TonB-dependent Receptor Plug Domain
MKRVCLLLFALVTAVAPIATAQVQSGTVSGVIQDQQGGVLPGVTVTLTGSDRTLTFVTGEDGRYRFLNVPPGSYRVSAEMSGFSTLVREDVVVVVGSSVELPFSMRVASVQETVTVEGTSPIVDSRATGTATNFTQDELSRIPTSRDPWALLRTVPGVQMDRVNIAGNETGQQSNFASKGSSRYDTVWTMDGIVITDMSATGGSPTYFDYDAFDEIQISTSGNDIRQPTGGAGLNFVVKRGTNQYRGTARGYFTNDALEGSNVPDELRALGVTSDTADHNDQISDYGFDLGGPIIRDKVWAWGSWTQQDIRLIRSAGALTDRTILKTHNIKGNWQVSSNDMINVLWFNGDKLKYGRATGDAQVLAKTATWNQGNAYPENRPHGLLKFENNHVFNANLFLSSKYAYYGTGFSLEPEGGLADQASVSTRLGQAFGTTRALRFLRPQQIVNLDANHFRTALGGSHDFKFGFGWRRTDATSQTIWPGNMIQAQDNSLTNRVARIYRNGDGTNRTEYLSLYIGDTFSRGPLTLDLGLRFDRQTGKALASTTESNAAFPDLVPGIDFAGYDAPFSWNTLHPRVGVTWALDDSRRTLLRANFSRYAGQLDGNIVGFSNPSANAGYVDYPWEDLNGDLFVQDDEVRLDLGFIQPGGGFNPADPRSVVSADSIDPDLKAPVTTGIVIGFERELMPNLAVTANYSWSHSKNLVGLSGAADPLGLVFIPWRGLSISDYDQIGTLTGTLPDGAAYSVPLFAPDAAVVAANGNGRELTNYEGYSTTYNGIELSVIKRMSNRWMMRAAFAYNNPREHYDTGRNVLGNPTRYESSSLVDGGVLAPRSAGSGAGDVFVNGKWQINVNGAYDLGRGFEVAGNLFARQGNPYPIFEPAALGVDGTIRVLVSPEIDTFRFDDIWNLDLRLAKNLDFDRLNLQLVADLFNVMNANTELNRQRNITNPNFERLTQNLSPRILRFGVRVGF